MKQSVRSVVLISCVNVIIFTMPKLNSLAILLLKNSFSRMCVCARAHAYIYIRAYVYVGTYAYSPDTGFESICRNDVAQLKTQVPHVTRLKVGFKGH